MGCVLGGRKQKHASWKGGTQHLVKWNTPLKFNITPEKLPGPNRKGSSSFPTIFQGFSLAVKKIGGVDPFAIANFYSLTFIENLSKICKQLWSIQGLEPAISPISRNMSVVHKRVKKLACGWKTPQFSRNTLFMYIYIYIYIYICTKIFQPTIFISPQRSSKCLKLVFLEWFELRSYRTKWGEN